MKKRVVIGIDTSNYTTSYAIITDKWELVANLKHPLPVKEGERGLRQSDAVFAHVKNLPHLAEQAKEYLVDCEIVAIGVSEKPRNVEGSYMPCFLAGVAVAENLACALGVPLYRFSHQCGHIMAVIFSSGRYDVLNAPFAAYHVSGGTTELLRINCTGDGFITELFGGTEDLNAGQIIDRIGVCMGLPFPAGKHIEELALKCIVKPPRRKPTVKGMSVNLSGLENLAIRLYEESGDASQTAVLVLDYVGRAIELTCDAFVENQGKMPFVFAGGVMCNSIIKARLMERFDGVFAEPAMSADNAVGVAALALRAFRKKQ